MVYLLSKQACKRFLILQTGVQRERAEAGVLLLNERLAQKAKHGIAVKRERTRQFPLPPVTFYV